MSIPTNEEIMKLLKSIDTKIDATSTAVNKLDEDTKKKLDEVITSVKENSEKIKEVSGDAKKAIDATKVNEKKIKQIELKVAGYEGNTETLKSEIELLKAKELENHVTIAGIKFQNNENLADIFNKVCGMLKANINDNDTNDIYRTPY